MAGKTSSELLVMGRIDRQLEALKEEDEAAAARVIAWLAQKWLGSTPATEES